MTSQSPTSNPTPGPTSSIGAQSGDLELVSPNACGSPLQSKDVEFSPFQISYAMNEQPQSQFSLQTFVQNTVDFLDSRFEMSFEDVSGMIYSNVELGGTVTDTTFDYSGTEKSLMKYVRYSGSIFFCEESDRLPTKVQIDQVITKSFLSQSNDLFQQYEENLSDAVDLKQVTLVPVSTNMQSASFQSKNIDTSSSSLMIGNSFYQIIVLTFFVTYKFLS